MRQAALIARTPMDVRFREDATLVFADLKRPRFPPPLLKLHGDFTARGQHELVGQFVFLSH
jgi:hypothetical protein